MREETEILVGVVVAVAVGVVVVVVVALMVGGIMKKLVPGQEVSGEGLEGLLGQRITVWCMNYIYTGDLAGVNGDCILLENAGVVYETGQLSDKEWGDMQPLPHACYIMQRAIESFMVLPNLRNRLAVAVLKDLVASAPKTFNALSNWEFHAGFWLAELAECPRNPDQLTCWTGLLGMALIQEHSDYTFAQACQSLRNHMRLHQVLKEGA